MHSSKKLTLIDCIVMIDINEHIVRVADVLLLI